MNDLQKNTEPTWGDQWTLAVEQLSTIWSKQMPRGRDYADKGHVTKLDVRSGKIIARIQGSKSKPYTTSLELTPNKPADWERLVADLVKQAHWAASFANGRMPKGIEQRFQEKGLSLFPMRNSELIATCSCPEKGRPCKHMAAAHYAFAKALDRDPFLIFQLRGMDRDAFIDLFHRAWYPDAPEESFDEESYNRDPACHIAPLNADRFNRSEDDLADIPIHLRVAGEGQSLIDRLGDPPGWSLPLSTADFFRPVVDAASARALELMRQNGDELQDGDDEALVVEEDDRDASTGVESLFQMLKVSPEKLAERQSAFALPASLPGAALLQSAIGADVSAAEKNQARAVGRRKVVEAAAPPPQPSQPVVLRRRSGPATSAEVEPAPVVTTPAAPADDGIRVRTRRKVIAALPDTLVEAPADAPAGPPVVTRRRKVVDMNEPAPAPKKAAPRVEEEKPAPAPTPAPAAAKPAATRKAAPAEPVVEVVSAAAPVTRRARTTVGGRNLRPEPILADSAARTAWQEGDAQKAFDNALEAWKLEPSDVRYQLMAGAADQLNGVAVHLEPLANQVVDDARRAGRQLNTQQLLILLTAGRYDDATEFIMAMDDAAWVGDDPPGAIYLSFILMVLCSERSVPEKTNLTLIWDELFARGEKNFPDFEDPPAPVGAWLDFAIQDIPIDESLEPQFMMVARNLGMGLLEVARARPVAMRPSKVAALAIAVAEALLLINGEDDSDAYTSMANARAAADPLLGASVRDSLKSSELLGYHSLG